MKVLIELVGVLGCAAVVYGLWLAWPPLAWVCGGCTVVALAIVGVGTERSKSK